MFEQLTQLVQQFGQEHVTENDAVPNEHNEAIMSHASDSILSSLKNIAGQEGGNEILAGLFQGNNASDASNPVVQEVTNQLSSSLGEKFGLSGDAASGVAGSLIPKVLGSLIGGAKDPNNSSFNVSDVIGAITGGGAGATTGGGGLMEMVTKYGGMVGLDQNGDGKIDLSDATAAVEKKGGFGALLGKLFGK